MYLLCSCLSWLCFAYNYDFLFQKLFILRLLDTIDSQIAFFLNFYRNLPIENMPGGTLWGQAQLRIFDRKLLPALKYALIAPAVVIPTTI
jgi:hypothetical protein